MFNEWKTRAGLMMLMGCVSLTPALAAEKLGKARTCIYAQTLANEVMASHPELVVIGLHALKPGNKVETMIASNLDRIGKKDDEDDLAVSHERKTILAPNIKDPPSSKWRHRARRSGKTIGSISAVFKYTAGDDEVKMHRPQSRFATTLRRKFPTRRRCSSPRSEPDAQSTQLMTLVVDRFAGARYGKARRLSGGDRDGRGEQSLAFVRRSVVVYDRTE